MLQICTVQWVKIICWLSRAMLLPAVSYSFKLRSHKHVLYFRLHHQRLLEVFWPNNTALFDSKYKYENKDLITHINGSVRVEVPLQTRHTGNLVYGYKARQHCISFWNFNHLRIFFRTNFNAHFNMNMYVTLSSTCFGPWHTHLQEEQLHKHSIWYPRSTRRTAVRSQPV